MTLLAGVLATKKGGSFGSADPVTGVSVGYVINQMAEGIAGNPHATALCQAIHESL